MREAESIIAHWFATWVRWFAGIRVIVIVIVIDFAIVIVIVIVILLLRQWGVRNMGLLGGISIVIVFVIVIVIAVIATWFTGWYQGLLVCWYQGWFAGIRESPPELLPSATRSHLHTNNTAQQGHRKQEEKIKKKNNGRKKFQRNSGFTLRPWLNLI